jgi:hypothetical protein
MIKKLTAYIILLALQGVIVNAQEIVSGLEINKAVAGHYCKGSVIKGDGDVVEIPFFDDFSENLHLPVGARWSDDFAFINNTYTDKQITLGVATLDALDNTGRLYETANSTGFEADHLTSQPINLNYLPSDNIRLSFFYQPGGLGDLPETKDSLTLQFFAPLENKWYSVWKAAGGTVRKIFKAAIIPITQTRYLKNGFKFRFINWASLSPNLAEPSIISNCDHWNIDYVYLDRNRNEADTTLTDVAFRTPLRSILKTHEAMPWKQFRQVFLQEMGSVIPIHYRNNDIIVRNVTRNFVIRDIYNNSVTHSFSAGATNIDPLTDIDFNANLIYTFNTAGNDSALFRITATLITDDFDPKENDTIKYDQVFGNYFAFDDGTPEGGYGINGLGSKNAMVALRFKSYMQDTVRAVNICFNDSYMNSNLRSFDLMIWNDNNDLPGEVIYKMEGLMVEQGDDINEFHTYVLPDGVMVDDVFYVGWKQRSETFLNAGFDVNTPHNGKQFYWLNGTWYQSQVNGSVMIRPVVGDPLKTTSADDPEPEDEKSSFKLWPNPAGDIINLQGEDLAISGKAYITIIDLQGRQVLKVPYSEQIDISSLQPGFYTVVGSVNGRPSGYIKLVKNR